MNPRHHVASWAAAWALLPIHAQAQIQIDHHQASATSGVAESAELKVYLDTRTYDSFRAVPAHSSPWVDDQIVSDAGNNLSVAAQVVGGQNFALQAATTLNVVVQPGLGLTVEGTTANTTTRLVDDLPATYVVGNQSIGDYQAWFQLAQDTDLLFQTEVSGTLYGFVSLSQLSSAGAKTVVLSCPELATGCVTAWLPDTFNGVHRLAAGSYHLLLQFQGPQPPSHHDAQYPAGKTTTGLAYPAAVMPTTFASGTGQVRFTAMAVPEPDTRLLLALGLGGVTIAARRRRPPAHGARIIAP